MPTPSASLPEVLQSGQTAAPCFVLVHGAWHAGSCWGRVVKALREHGFLVLAPDLPGHGDNPMPPAKITLKTYVANLSQLLDTIPGKVILVGHSMAGIVISEVAARCPGKIACLVYLCAYLPQHGDSLFGLIAQNRSPGEAPTAIELALQMSADKRSCTIPAEDYIPLFCQLAPTDVAQEARTALAVQATLPLAAAVDLQGTGFAGLPRTYIACTEDRVIPLRHQHRMLARQPCDTLLQIESDHSPFLSQPRQLAVLLAACIPQANTPS